MSHATSAFCPFPFKEATIMTVDGFGEWNIPTLGNRSILSDSRISDIYYFLFIILIIYVNIIIWWFYEY